MKKSASGSMGRRRVIKANPWLLCLASLLLFSYSGMAEEGDGTLYSQAQLDQMLAPIALYPDSLLSQILMASTYPLEIVEAARWSRDHPDLEGEEAVEAVADQEWDPSVKSLVAFPRVLARMNEDLRWTRRLGEAFLLHEEQVMETVQDLRRRADEAGNLETLEHLQVRREREVIYIEPVEREVVYVPYYRPTVVYGSWWRPAYPPVYWAPPPSYRRTVRIVWWPGVRVSAGFYYSHCDWPRRQIVVVNHHHHHHHHVRHSGGTSLPRYEISRRWRHDPAHRRSVSYRSEHLNQRYGRTRGSADSRVRARGDRDHSSPAVDNGSRTFRRQTRRDVLRGAEEAPGHSPASVSAEGGIVDRELSPRRINRSRTIARDAASVRRPGDTGTPSTRPVGSREPRSPIPGSSEERISRSRSDRTNQSDALRREAWAERRRQAAGSTSTEQAQPRNRSETARPGNVRQWSRGETTRSATRQRTPVASQSRTTEPSSRRSAMASRRSESSGSSSTAVRPESRSRESSARPESRPSRRSGEGRRGRSRR